MTLKIALFLVTQLGLASGLIGFYLINFFGFVN
jgi:hypothetical protein